MPSRPAKALFASTGFRIALLQALLLAAAMLAAATAAWITTRDLATRDLRARITVEAEAIKEELVGEGMAAAIDAVLARAERPGALKYRLLGATGTRLAGDLEAPALAAGWTTMVDGATGTAGDRHAEMLVLTTALPGGARLSVGDDIARATMTRDAIFRAFAIWGLVALVLGLVASVWLTRRALRRMDAVVTILSAAGKGALSARTGFRRRNGDDIDALADGVDDMLDKIAVLVASLRRVSADVAHELRTPLTHVRQRLDQAAAAPDEAARKAALVLADADLARALRLFDAMLRLAEIDAGLARSRFAPVDLGDVVDRVADAYRPDIELSGRFLDVAVAAGAVVFGDADMLAQLLANLLDNTLKYTPAGTRVGVVVVVAADVVTLAVSDDGPGIDASALPDVTRPFRRGDGAAGTPGSGLGLAIVGAVARLHGASCRFGNASPGLVVRLVFPAAIIPG